MTRQKEAKQELPLFWGGAGYRGGTGPVVRVDAQSLSWVPLFPTPRTVARQAPLSMGFSRQEYQSGLQFPPPACCMKVKVAQSCSTLCDPMDYTVHGILHIRILEWVAFPFSRGSSQPRDPRSPALRVDSLPVEPQGKPCLLHERLTNEIHEESEWRDLPYTQEGFRVQCSLFL